MPCGLQHLLCTYARGHADTRDGHEDARKRLYRRLYSLLWVCATSTVVGSETIKKKKLFRPCLYHIQFGSNQSLGKKVGHNHPTYVFPSGIKAVVRARFPKSVRDYSDPEGPQVKLKTKLKCAYSLSYFFFTGIQADIQRLARSQVASRTPQVAQKC